jgi:hypothetical protein
VVNPDDLEACRRLLDQGGSTDEVLTFLRDRGRGKIASIVVVSKLLGLDRTSAKLLVHNSSVLADRYDADEAFHDQVEAASRDEPRPDLPAGARRRPTGFKVHLWTLAWPSRGSFDSAA